MFWNFIIAIAAFAVQLVLTPKPQDVKPKSLEDFELPTAEEGREIPVLFGTRPIQGPNVVWYGDLWTKALKGARRYGLFGPRQTTGHKYFLGVHMTLCHGVADSLKQIRVGDKVVWSGSNAGGRITINKEDLFGGNDGEGGISDDLDIEMGAPDQLQNDYLVSVLGEDVPAFRGVVGVVLRQMYLGNSPYLKPWAFTLQRIYKRSNGSEQWYPEKAGILATGGLAVAARMLGSGGGDGARVGMQFLDADGDPIQDEILWSEWAQSDTWEHIAVDSAIPAGAVSVRVYMHMVKNAGDRNDARIDDITVDNGPDALLVANPGAESGTTGWTVETGSLSSEYASGEATGAKMFSGSDEVKAYQDIALSATNGAASGAGLSLDMNPAHIIRECLTDREWGLGYNESDVDDIFFTAAADTFYDEGFGLSLLWQTEEEIQEFVQIVQSHVDAFVYTSKEEGKFRIKPIRHDYELEDLPIVDEDDVITWNEVRRRQPSEAVTSVFVKYFNRAKRKEGSRAIHNPAQLQQTGRMISAMRNYPGINTAELAVRVGTRDLQSLSAGMVSGRITAKRTIESLNPGDPFRLLSSRHKLSGEVMRVGELRFGDGRKNAIDLKFMQDIFHLGTDILVDDSGPDWENPKAAPAAVYPRLVWEMPYREMVQMVGASDTATLLAGDPDAGLIQVAGGRPTGTSLNALVKVLLNSASAYSGDEIMNFCPAALLDGAIAGTAAATTITVRDDVDLEDLEIGTLGAILGTTPDTTEIVRLDSIVDSTLTVARGCLDTIPQAHADGAQIVFFDDISTSDFESYAASDEARVKLLTVTGSGTLAQITSPTDTINFDSRAIRPYRPANVRVNGEEDGPVDATAGSLVVTFVTRNRLTELKALAWTTAAKTPEAGQTTVIELYDEDTETLLETYSAVTSPFTVPSADYAGYFNVRVKVLAERDGYRSLQGYEIAVTVDSLPPVNLTPPVIGLV